MRYHGGVTGERKPSREASWKLSTSFPLAATPARHFCQDRASGERDITTHTVAWDTPAAPDGGLFLLGV